MLVSVLLKSFVWIFFNVIAAAVCAVSVSEVLMNTDVKLWKCFERAARIVEYRFFFFFFFYFFFFLSSLLLRLLNYNGMSITESSSQCGQVWVFVLRA